MFGIQFLKHSVSLTITLSFINCLYFVAYFFPLRFVATEWEQKRKIRKEEEKKKKKEEGKNNNSHW